MNDIYDITEYIKSLKKGFDKDEFKEKIEELADAADGPGLVYEEFHNLFKVWLNLTIPVTRWMDIGVCLVPRARVEARTVEYARRWLLVNYQQNQISFSRIGFVLDWLTAAMVCDSVDMESLEIGYEVFYMLATYEILTPHSMKLVYTLTKPSDVTRRRVLELLDISKKREAKKSKCRQIQILLGLFKSYKPEFVPEAIPAFSVHTNFRKISPSLLARFGRSKALSDIISDGKVRLNWVNPINMKGNKKAKPLVPNMEFCHIGSTQYAGKQAQKTFLDFEDPASLLSSMTRCQLSRPARLRALLCNDTGLLLLATAPTDVHAFLAHDLRHTLDTCFFQPSPYTHEEKRDFLRRLARLQRTAQRPEPVLTSFLAQYLPFWNERDYFHEILALVEWISSEAGTAAALVFRPLGRAFLRAAPFARCAILNCLSNLYDNWTFCSSRKTLSPESRAQLSRVQSGLAAFTAALIDRALQVAPDDMRVLSWSLGAARTVLGAGREPPPVLAVALPLLGTSAALINDLAATMLLYKKVYTKLRKTTTNREIEDQVWTLQAYTGDMINCLWNENVLSERNAGLVFSKLPLQLIDQLKKLPNVDKALSIRSHVAFAAYTYALCSLGAVKDADNKQMFKVIAQELDYVASFLRKVVPELRG